MKKITRRAFITTGLLATGALIVGVAVRPGHRVPRLKNLVSDKDESLINAWVKISPNNRVTVIVPHCEMGQGVHTSLPMMLAEEMNLDWPMVDVLEAPADLEYANYALARGFIIGDVQIPKALVQTVNGAFLEITQIMKLQITGGSTAIRNTGIHAMRMAGAAAKAMLIDSAAEKWQLSAEKIVAQKGYLVHPSSGQKAPYSEFAELASKMTPPSEPQLKKPKDYQIVGTSPIRLDIKPKVDGSAQFGIDTLLPKMVFAAIAMAPVFGEDLLSKDDSEAKKMPGVVKIISLKNAVAVVAQSYWQAQQALQQVKIQWSTSNHQRRSSETIFSQFRTDLKQAAETEELETDFEKGDINSAKKASKIIVEAEYQVPYLAHSAMEPLNCTAHFVDGHCTLWTGCQNPLGFRSEVADALNIGLENVTLNNHYLGGGFGRRAIADYTVQAALISAQISQPVKLIWSREQDTRHDHYRQACVSQFSAGVDQNAKPLFWHNQFVDKHEPVQAPHIPYQIENQQIQFADSPTHIPFGPWRSVDHSLHAFFTESFIDELAHQADKDPYLYRRELLNHSPRWQKVLDSAANQANWQQPLVNGCGRGIAIHQSFNTIVAQVAEVEMVNNKVQILKVCCAVDVGLAINPDGLIAQMQSGIVFGLTAALYGEISIENGAVKQGNFDDYPMLRMKQSPQIEVEIINSGEALGGGGEPGTPPIAPAVANAIFAASGQRIRTLPLLKQLNG